MTADTDPAGGAPEESSSGDGERLDRVEAKVDRLAGLLEKILPASHADAQQRTEDRLDRASSVQEQVRAELARAREDDAKRADADAEKSERQQIREDLAKLREAPPQAPTPRRTKLLGWGDR